jgi:hypothetical protein
MSPLARPVNLPVESVVFGDPALPEGGDVIGRSREDREIRGWRLGGGPAHVSLIAGCHADEPVGPETLRRLVRLLSQRPPEDPLLSLFTWFLVPDANPDGAHRNAAWTGSMQPVLDHKKRADRGFDLPAYALAVQRELPGDDIEFGFPRAPEDSEARPENRAVAGFLAEGGPFVLHGTLHGMCFAPGPWFLLEESWTDRTAAMRDALRQRVREMGYALLDVDREGEKGFHRIDEGFSTRPDSAAMRAHFEALGDLETAALFRPSSMEYVRDLGGDPLTFVSEMPLFLLPPPEEAADPRAAFRAGTEASRERHAWMAEMASRLTPEEARREAAERGIRPMPIRDQMRLQVALVNEALRAALQ